MQDRKTGGARPIGQSAGRRTDADRAVSETLQLYHGGWDIFCGGWGRMRCACLPPS